MDFERSNQNNQTNKISTDFSINIFKASSWTAEGSGVGLMEESVRLGARDKNRWA